MAETQCPYLYKSSAWDYCLNPIKKPCLKDHPEWSCDVKIGIGDKKAEKLR